MRRLALLLLAACDAPAVLTVGPEIAHVALFEPGARSPLLPVGRASELIAERLEDARILGFSAEQLSSPVLAIDASEPLGEDTSGCGVLPAPAAKWRREGDAWVETSPSSEALTAEWLRPACGAPRSIQATCRGNTTQLLGASAATDAPCDWSLASGRGPTMSVQPGVYKSGCATLDGTALPFVSERWSADRTSYHAVLEHGEQSRCVVSARGEPQAPEPVLAVARLTDAEVELPPGLQSESPHLDVRALRGGGLTGFVIDRDARRGIAAVTPGHVCPASEATSGAWRIVDLDTLAVTTHARSAPPCLSGLRRVSAEGEPLRLVGFTVLSRPNRRVLRMREFDADLRETRNATVSSALPAGAPMVTDVLDARGTRYVLVVAANLEQQAMVVAVDLATWTATSSSLLATAHALELATDGELMVHMRNKPEICRFRGDLATPRCDLSCGRDIIASGSVPVIFAARARDPADGSLVLSGTDILHGLYVCGRDLWLRAHDEGTLISALHPLGPRRLLGAAVGRWGSRDFSARLVIADLELPGYEERTLSLPGVLVSALVEDGDRVWAVMPHDGVVARVELAPLRAP